MGRFFALFFLVCALGVSGQSIEGCGDLYVLNAQKGRVRVLAARGEGLLDTVVKRENLVLKYSQGAISFVFGLHDIDEPEGEKPLPEKTLVVSDMHGQLEAFVSLLKGARVVDGDLDWAWGGGRLIFAGDIMDRGRGDNGIAWLVYKLQRQAAEAGGRVDFLAGNHEDMVMKNDSRYVHKDHLAFAEKAGVEYGDLYGAQSELGRWFRSRRVVERAGDALFVHAGLSRIMVDSLYTVKEMNRRYSRYVGMRTKERTRIDSRNTLMFGGQGPLWYRGLVVDNEKNPGASSFNVDIVLKYYGARRVIVGHSEVARIDWRYGGRVVAVNVNHADNFAAGGEAALLIERGEYWAVGYNGEKIRLLSDVIACVSGSYAGGGGRLYTI